MIFLITNSHFDLYYLYSSTNFCKEENEINRYKEGLDMYTEFVCYIPKSKKNELNELVCNLINSDQ